MIFLDADSFPVFSFDLYWDGVGRTAWDSLGPEAQYTARLSSLAEFLCRFTPIFAIFPHSETWAQAKPEKN